MVRIGIITLLLVGTFLSCKKGDNDPFLSLMTRKARLSGEWKVISSEVTNGDTTVVYDGKNEVHKVSTVERGTLPTVVTYKFDKDGSYEINRTQNFPAKFKDTNAVAEVEIYLEKGKWNFTGGAGDTKSKEQILLLPEHIQTRIEGFAEVKVSTWEGQVNGSVYNIDMLKNKEMRWKYSLLENTASGKTLSEGTIDFQK